MKRKKKKLLKIIGIVSAVIALMCTITFFVINKMDKISLSPITVPSDIAEDEVTNYIMTQYFETFKHQGFYRRITDYKIRVASVHRKEDDYIVIACGYEAKPFIDDEMEWTLGSGMRLDNGWYFQYREYKFRIVDDNTYVLEKVVTGG